MLGKIPYGKYRIRIEVLARVLAAKGANGEEAESWPDSGLPYSAASDSLSSGEQFAQGIAAGTGYRKLRIKGRSIPVSDVDRVKIVASGELYNVTGVARDYDANDTIISLTRVIQQTNPQ